MPALVKKIKKIKYTYSEAMHFLPIPTMMFLYEKHSAPLPSICGLFLPSHPTT